MTMYARMADHINNEDGSTNVVIEVSIPKELNRLQSLQLLYHIFESHGIDTEFPCNDEGLDQTLKDDHYVQRVSKE